MSEYKFEPPEWMIPELDFAIIEELPVEGTMAGGLVPIGKSVRGLAKGRFAEIGLDGSAIGGRIRKLHNAGLVRQITTLINRGERSGSHGGSGTAYQATEAGLNALRAWKATQERPPLALLPEKEVSDGSGK